MEALHNYHIKRSIKPGVEHIFTFHGSYSTFMVHVKEAFDYYDTISCVGGYQKNEIKVREQMYSLRPKNIVEVGYPYFDTLASKYAEEKAEDNTVLIAPSWHDGNIFETCIISVVENLIKSGFKVIARPHDEFLKRNPKAVYKVGGYFKGRSHFLLDLDMRSSDSINRSALLITDWSGISFEWSLVKERPALYVNTPPKIKNKDYAELGIVPVEIQTRNIIGKSIDIEHLDKIGECARNLLINKAKYIEAIRKFRKQNFYNWGSAAKVGGEYILSALRENKASI
ncbi:MAG: CDP-glycerol glycerophosphotransferase family protein [Holosporales bacterium]|jgi:YidC/Oxa1 family membrane protein insertase|nr:CDP-glycerol glycerophosphotransferase family protein [Holosporales bacterium]